EQGSHPDFRRLEPETSAEAGEAEEGGERKGSSQISIDRVRSLTDFIHVSSHRGGAKVVLIHPAETLNVNAANALLKNLEEPPPQTYFVLVAHRWHQLLPTIRSRCEQVVLAAPSRDVARGWLETQKLRDAELALAHAGGAPLVALAFDEDYWRQRQALLAAITRPGFDALASAERMRETAPRLVLAWLQKWVFDLVSHKVTGRVRYNPDYSDAIAATAGRLDLMEALRFQRQVVGLQRIASHPLNARLFLEHLLLEYGALLRRGAATPAA
ncbi:MAG: DNA polymerase III subunit delta' C-terminal domain-containing protein, partial [Burkholderiales bacterium]